MSVMSEFHGITEDEAARMMAAQDEAAKKYFWAYPGEEWQEAFQASWLRENRQY